MENNFNETVSSLFKGMDSLLSTKTVVGTPTKIGDAIILPLVDVNFGVAAGAFAKQDKKSNSAGGGMGGKMTPSAVLVIQNGYAKMVNVKSEDTISKVMDFVPSVIDKVSGIVSKKDKKADEAAAEIIEDIGEELI